MSKKNKIGAFLGLTLVYFSSYIFVNLTSTNLAFKEATYINKTFAGLTIFENSMNNSEYFVDKSDLYDGKWTSGERINNSYKTVSVSLSNEVNPVPTSIGTSLTYIYRHSH